MDLTIKNNVVCNNAKFNKMSNINFKGSLSDKQTEKVLSMLKEKVSGIQTCPDMNGVKMVIDNLISKYSTNSVGIMFIPDADLEDFLGEEASKYNLKKLKGICVAVGDKIGPVENWSKAYEAIVVLMQNPFGK